MQRRDPVHELVEVAELLVGPDRTHDLVLAGEATLPMNRDVHIFAIVLHMNDDFFHQVPDDLLAILVGRAGGVPERGEVGGESGDPRPLLGGKLRRLFAEEAVVIVADLRSARSVSSQRCSKDRATRRFSGSAPR